MHINYISVSDSSMASYRYRILMPTQALQRLGYKVSITKEPIPGSDVAVFSKHFYNDPLSMVAKCKKMDTTVVYDVCDYHLDDPDRAKQYFEMLNAADLVTVSTPELSGLLSQYQPTVIADPYEYDEADASFPNKGGAVLKLLWFGHKSNLPPLLKVWPYLIGHEVMVLTNEEIRKHVTVPIIPWSPAIMLDSMKHADVVIIPQEKDNARGRVKGNNRMIEAIRRGKFVIASDIPSHKEFDRYMFIGELKDGIAWVLRNKDEIIPHIKAAQDYIRDRYSPENIGNQWAEVFNG